MPDRLFDYDGTWFRGMKSDSDPGQIPLGYYWAGMNVLNVGGMISCRPGYRCVVELPDGNLQGLAVFRPGVGLEQLVTCVDGHVYVAEYPFRDWRLLDNVHMEPSAKQIFWCLTEQSARRLNDDLESPIEVVTPRKILIMQDGGSTAPAWYDGSNSGHLRDKQFETPAGGPMCWIGDRLWVAKGSSVFASDIANPLSFREQLYLGGVAALIFSGEVTALATTPGLESPQLLVFTEETGSLVRASIRERATWESTVDFQREIFSIGAASQRSVVNHFGQLAWFSNAGVVFFDSAVLSRQRARLPIRDNEMLASKNRLSSDLSLVAGAAYGSYMLFSVPFEDRYNRHTWVLNDASFETINDASGPSWSGYWTGTRPVEWVYGTMAGAHRIYHVSVDHDGKNRLWEAFIPERLDNGCPITWSVETRGYFGQTATSKEKLDGADCKFRYADLALTAIEEDLDLGVFYAGGMRGAYKQIMSKRISVARGNLNPGLRISATTELYGYKPQSRRERTEEATQLPGETESGSCPAEYDKLEDTDDSFQLLIVGHGPATFRYIRAWAMSDPENFSADGEACQDESAFNVVKFDGAGASSENLADANVSALAKEVVVYSSNQTATVSQLGFTAVGVGYAESVVAQRSADRVAERNATRMAEADLSHQVPPVLSVGGEILPE